MTRFHWFPFDANEWRDVSDLFSETARGIYIELLSVFWISQPVAYIALSSEDWARRLRLQKTAARMFPATVKMLATQGLVEVVNGGATISIAIPWLTAEYRKRAKDADRHGRRVPGAGDGTFQPTNTEGSKEEARNAPEPTDGTFRATPTEASGGHTDKTYIQTSPEDSTPSSSGAAMTAPAPKKKPRTRRAANPRWEDAGRVLAYYAAKHPDYMPDKAGRTLIIARFGDGFTVEQLCLACDGAHLPGSWHEQNGALTLGVIYGTSDKVTKFIEAARASLRSRDSASSEYFDASKQELRPGQ